MRSPATHRASAVLVVLWAGLSGGATFAQGTSSAPDEAFVDVVNVDLVNVEVWVTDRDGRPVHGLEASDFQVLEDGEPVPVTHFVEIGGRGRGDAARESAAEAVAGGGVAPADEETSADETPEHWVLYVDQLHLQPASLKRLVKDVRSFLESSEIPAARTLVLRQDESLHVEAAFGSSPEELDEAMRRLLDRRSVVGQTAAQAKRLAIDRLQDIWLTILQQNVPGDPCDRYLRQAPPEVERYAREAERRVGATLDTLETAASILAGLPGVKFVLYVGDTLELHPGTDLLGFVRDLCPGRSVVAEFDLPEDLGPAFRELTRHANTNRVTIHTIQGGGLRTDLLGGADQGSLQSMGLARSRLGAAIRESERDGLIHLARETGGRAVLEQNRLTPALDRLAREARSYYSLAYSPPHGGDGGEHRIEVRLADRSLQARHRTVYRDKTTAERIDERLASALYLGISDNSHGVRLGAGELTAAGEPGRFTLRLHVLVPLEELVFLPTRDSSVARLEISVSRRDLEGSRVETVTTPFRLDRSEDEGDGMVDLVVSVGVEEGAQLLAVALRDQAADRTSFISTTIDVRPGGETP